MMSVFTPLITLLAEVFALYTAWRVGHGDSFRTMLLILLVLIAFELASIREKITR